MYGSIDRYFRDIDMLPSTIPTFMLYGEEPGDAVAEFAHIETIAVRSSVYDWEISPHRHMRCIQVLMVLHGQVEFRCDGAVRTLEAPCFMVVPIGSVHGFRFTPSTMGYVLTLSAGFTRRAERKEDVMLALLTQGGAGTIPPEYEERVAWLCKEMLAVQGDWRAPQPLFLTLAEALARSLPAVQDQEASSPADERLAGFRRLVELHLREHRSVDWYAGQLNVTAKTLTRLCRRVLDCTPTDLIHARLVMEAQRLLTFTNANVVQVADQLGFADSSYFSRFYRRLTGHSPQQDKRGPAGSRIPPR